ncbi:ATP-binding protein [Cobetia marina]|uniref:ATP-binding protein n=1 Tax=Cobetia marina TaxID=28258 RepID=UPI001F103D2A|nr:ATP-binding protein [Cobetia marina]
MKDTRLPHHWRLLLAIVLPIGLMLCVWQAVAVARSQSLERLTHEADNELRLTAASLRGQLSQHAYLPRLVAENDQLRAFLDAPDDPSAEMALNQRLDRMRALAKVSDLYLVNDVGTTIAASNWRSASTFIGQNYRFRPYWKDAIDGGEARFYGLGTSSGERGYFFSASVVSPRGRRGVVVAKVQIAALEAAWLDQNADIMVTDPHGVIFIASQPDRVLRTLDPLSDETRNRLLDTQRYANQRLRPLRLYHREALSDLSTPEPPLRLDAVTTVELLQLTPGDLWQHAWLSLSRPLPDIGWRLHVLKPLAPLRGSIWQAAGLAAGGYVLLCLLAGLGWQRLRILRERRLFAERERQSLAASQQRVRGIIDRTQAGLCILDERAHLVYLNPTAVALFGSPLSADASRDDSPQQPSAREGRDLRELFLPAERALLDHLTHPRPIGPLEVHGLRSGVAVPLELSCAPLPSPNGPRWLVTVFDVSERRAQAEALAQARDAFEQRVVERTRDLAASNARLSAEVEERTRAERELRATRDELIQTAKLAVLGELAAGINHELNQPLAAIRAYAENASAFLARAQTPQVESNLRQITELTQRMGEISAQLRQFSRKSGDRLEAVDLATSLDYALRLLQPRRDAQAVDITREQSTALPRVRAEPVRLEQVLVNLLSNALDALADRPSAPACLQLNLHERAGSEGTQVVLEVHDNGPGLAPAQLTRVFEPFYTQRADGKGLGLGLSISARIVADLGGTLEAHPSPLGGALFRLTLPASGTPSQRLSPSAAANSQEPS